MISEALRELPETTSLPMLRLDTAKPDAAKSAERANEWARVLIYRQADDYARILQVLREMDGRVFAGTATYDPPSIAAGAQVTTTITVTGAVLGDPVIVSFSLDLQGLQVTGYVSAANTVTVVLRNGTGGAIDLASGTLRAVVLRF